MGEVINLNQFRKHQTKQKKKAQATENRVKYGKSGHLRKLELAEKEMDKKRIEGHKLDPSSDADKPEKDPIDIPETDKD